MNNIEEIIQSLIKYDDAYFNDQALVSDSEYDRIKRLAFSLEPSNSYFAQVGSDVRGGKIKLPYKMGSLDQVYEKEITAWVSKYSLASKKVVITNKLDGTSCMLIYRNGNLAIAYSRGNGHEGADITRHIKNIPSVPTTIANVNYLVVRAEVIMKDEVFQQHFSTEFKTALGCVAGCMNRSVTEQSTLDKIDVVAYQVVETDYASIDTKESELNTLKSFGFLTVKHAPIIGSVLNDAYLVTTLAQSRIDSEYGLDGLVLTIDDYVGMDSFRNSDSINPEHSIKYKVLDESSVVETIVTDVIWEISKNGYLKPRIEIVPVDLFGTTVTYASGFNARFIIDSGIGKGARIKITKAGMVIPYVVGVVTPTPATLPDTKTFGLYALNDNGVEFVVNDPDTNSTVLFKRVLDFFETLSVDQLRESSLSKVMDTYNLIGTPYNDVIVTLSDLTEREWVNAVGANGSKIYASLHRRYQNMKLETLLGAIAYMGTGFGVRKAKKLLEGVTGDVYAATVNDIENIDGFDTKTATQAVNGLSETKKLIDSLSCYIKIVKADKTAELSGVSIVMTGFRDADLHERVETMGGKVQSAVNKKTTHLLALDTSVTTGKLAKARQLGVKVVTPDEFKDEYNL